MTSIENEIEFNFNQNFNRFLANFKISFFLKTLDLITFWKISWKSGAFHRSPEILILRFFKFIQFLWENFLSFQKHLRPRTPEPQMERRPCLSTWLSRSTFWFHSCKTSLRCIYFRDSFCIRSNDFNLFLFSWALSW